jgi:hypothetical protein
MFIEVRNVMDSEDGQQLYNVCNRYTVLITNSDFKSHFSIRRERDGAIVDSAPCLPCRDNTTAAYLGVMYEAVKGKPELWQRGSRAAVCLTLTGTPSSICDRFTIVFMVRHLTGCHTGFVLLTAL